MEQSANIKQEIPVPGNGYAVFKNVADELQKLAAKQ